MTENKISIIIVLVFVLPMMGKEASADKASDLKLARKFSPILILTEDTGNRWGDIRVIKPEPVEIVGADSLSNLYFTAKSLDQRTRIVSDTLGINWHPRIDKDQIESNCNVDFSMNRFALLASNCNVYGSRNGKQVVYQGVWSRCQSKNCGLPEIPVQGPIFPEFFDYPGVNPTEWDSAYFGTGPKAGSNLANTAWPFSSTRSSGPAGG